jgi:flagellar assembly protein FliH
MKCWPEPAAGDVELFDYPPVAAPPLTSWESFENASLAEDASPSGDERMPETPEANQSAANETHGEELLRSFESGRERGFEEGSTSEREACAASANARELRRIEEAAGLVESFHLQQTRYFETVEREVVRLALAIAARILRRQAQMDPLLLSGAVRAALGQLSSSTQACLRVPPSDLELWTDTIANLPNLQVKPSVVAGDGMRLGECILETELGSVDLSMSMQLAEIERGLFDRTGLDCERTQAVMVAEDLPQ